MKITKIDTVIKQQKKLKVAAYCRVSTGSDEQLESLETQKRHYESFIKLHSDWEFAGLYYDRGVSGTKTALRYGFQNMLSDCRAGLIDKILVKSISRFSRNTTDCISVIRELQALGIYVYFEKENIDTGTQENELILSILSSMAAEESSSISQNSKWSVKRRFENGTFKISCAPYGYRVTENGDLEIEEKEAETVNRIFEMIVSGKGAYTIAKELNERGISPRRALKWSECTIYRIIENEKYIGDTLLQKTYTDSTFKRHRNDGEKDSYLITDSHDAIIRREIFEKANEIIKFRARHHHANSGVYMNRYCFSGNIKCGICGDFLKRMTLDDKSICWSCKTHIHNKEECSLKQIRDDSIKAAFLTMINKLIFSRKVLLKPYFESLSLSGNGESADLIKNIREKQTEIYMKTDSLRKLRAHNIIDSVVFTREITALENEMSSLKIQEERLSNVQTHDAVVLRETEKILKFTEHSIMHECFDDEIYSRFIDYSTVQDRHTIIFHLKCGLNLKEELQCTDTKQKMEN